MSTPRPIHQPPREIRHTPDETEPSYSYEQESFIPKSEDEVEDEFHRRVQLRGNFWRTSDSSASVGPSFSSMNMRQRSDSFNDGGKIEEEGPMPRSPPPPRPKDRAQSWTTGDGNRNRTSGSSTAKDKQRKDQSRQRNSARRMKTEAQNSDLDLGHLETEGGIVQSPPEESLSRETSSECSRSPSLLYGKTLQTPHNGSLSAKGSSSLIFPTGIEAPGDELIPARNTTRRAINLMLDQCETVRFPFKKKLILENMNLVASDVPVKDLVNTSLGNSLHKLSLAGNRLITIPPELVQCLPVLKHLDLSQCELYKLPDKWNLPQLKRLNLSHNRISEFPDEIMLEGLPELQDLNMYGNKVAEIIVPHNPKLLSKLDTLNVGNNDLVYLPDEFDQLKALRTLKIQRNFLERIPMRVCEMDIKVIDVSSNPIISPPIETCERGMCSMKRYYHCLRNEEQSKHKALEEVQKRLAKARKREECKFRKFFIKSPTTTPKSPSEETPAPQSMLLEDQTRAKAEQALVSTELHNDLLSAERIVKSMSVDAEVDNVLVDRKVLASLERESTTTVTTDAESFMDDEAVKPVAEDEITVNDTLKVIFVGMAMAGKTSMIKRLIEGKDAVIPKRDERTVGVDIYEWEPITVADTRIELEDDDLAKTCGDVDVKFSVWDFAGQHVYHATHELFFSPRALYVLVWDMGATNQSTLRRRSSMDDDQGAYRLSYESSDDEEDDDDFMAAEEARRADRALERDIDEKVQFWVDCIQSSVPGAAILPVASFDDYFEQGGNKDEAERRCNVMKRRLLRHEERRIAGIKNRLKVFYDENRANDEGALRLQQLLCPYKRPKLIFGEDERNCVVRVSGTKFTGFDHLTEKIVRIATGRERAGWKYPIFRGHVGAQIPRMRLQVREAVREMRDRFKVVEWGYFLSALRERDLDSVEDISDALHFLTNIGELSYFGNVFPDKQKMATAKIDEFPDCSPPDSDENLTEEDDGEDSDDMDDVEENRRFSMDDMTSALTSNPDDGSLSTTNDLPSTGLSQYVFLNPRWLVAAVACILRHDLDREIRDTRRSLMRLEAPQASLERGVSFYETHLNCPVITANDACMLWHAKRFTKKAAERAQQYSNNLLVTPFDFLQRLLIRFGVFVPIDLDIDKAFLGGKEYARNNDLQEGMEIALTREETGDSASFFFLPSLLGPGEPSEAWTYKNTDSWKTTVCHSVLFPDGVPPGLMERITASVLSNIYAVAKQNELFRVKEILCWRTAFFIKIGTEVSRNDEEIKESVVEIFAHLVDRESHLCVGSDSMGAGTRRLILSGKGQVGDGGRKIWTGGYLIVIKAIGRVMAEYGGLEYEKQGFCPECLSKKAVSQASAWDWNVIRSAGQNGDEFMRCHHGHRVDTRLIAGPCEFISKTEQRRESRRESIRRFADDSSRIIPVNDLLQGVVVVGLWDGKTRMLVRVGSGFVVDRKRGLIVTASHTLMNIWGDRKTPFGEAYYGLREGKIVIGVIPRNKGSEIGGETKALFRYFAKIAAKDPNIDEKGECQADVCVLRITTRMENDVGGNGEGIGDQPETLLLNNPEALKRERLQQLKVTEKCELDEQVRILGYNQGGEGLLRPGESLNRYVDFARGYVCKKFATGEEPGYLRQRFKPREEIVVICPTIGGHSGGPCVNQQGEVIGILSRADPTENQRCYLVPASEWKEMLKTAKNSI